MLGFVLSLSLTFYIDPVVSGVSTLLLLMIFLVLLYTGWWLQHGSVTRPLPFLL